MYFFALIIQIARITCVNNILSNSCVFGICVGQVKCVCVCVGLYAHFVFVFSCVCTFVYVCMFVSCVSVCT